VDTASKDETDAGCNAEGYNQIVVYVSLIIVFLIIIIFIFRIQQFCNNQYNQSQGGIRFF
jgi:hypothetical protein